MVSETKKKYSTDRIADLLKGFPVEAVEEIYAALLHAFLRDLDKIFERILDLKKELC